MGRPRTATNVLEARGAFKQNPARKKARAQEPKGKSGFPSRPPSHLKPEVKKTWKEVVSMVPDGVLTASDVLSVEIVATLMAEFRTKPYMETARVGRLTTEMNKLGLSPSSRASLTVPQDDEDTF